MEISDYLTITKDIMYAYNESCRPIIVKYDIPQVSFDILMFLTNNPEFCTAQEICRYRNIKKNLVSVHVERLVQAGLLERGAVPEDRRKVALSCTEAASDIIRDGLAMQKIFFGRLFDGIGRDEWEEYLRITRIISKNSKSMTKAEVNNEG